MNINLAKRNDADVGEGMPLSGWNDGNISSLQVPLLAAQCPPGQSALDHNDFVIRMPVQGRSVSRCRVDQKK